MKVCFIGHRTIEKTEELIFSLKETVLSLIEKGAETFLFGSKSAFNSLSWEVVSEMKEQYSHIKRVYVRSTNKQISKSYKTYLLKFYEETYFPPKIENAGRASYVERNQEMIDESDFCVFYYNKNYLVPLKKFANNGRGLPFIRNSGTKIAYNYALTRKKQVINIYRQTD